MQIKSNRDGFEFALDQTSRADYYQAELACGSMNAAVEFYEMGLRPVKPFFDDLAASWRGWDGERQWTALEGEVRLSATHDGLGTVTLAVELRSGHYTDAGASWSARGVLYLDAGGLDALARQAAQLTD
jgi:hypothetical protein